MDERSADMYERRREQVRRAQKTHRARKATYIKSLEDELRWLRQKHAVCQNELATIQYNVQLLCNVLLSNGLSLPELKRSSATEHRTAAIKLVGETYKSRSIHATMPPAPPYIPVPEQSREAASDTSPIPTNLEQEILPPHQHDASNQASLSSPPAGNANSVQAGVDFVLALEQPCINHHKIPMPELLLTGDIANGHHSMLSHPIMRRSPSFSFNPFNRGYPKDAQWDVPAIELETLLEFSQKLDLDESEITPVQAWQAIRQHQRYSLLSKIRVEEMRKRLFPLVKCNGFGAVMDRDAFEQIMNSTFVSI